MARIFTIPQFPVLADVWYLATKCPPVGPRDATISISISPLDPRVWAEQPLTFNLLTATHIIRTPSNPLIVDGWNCQGVTSMFPGTVFEVPVDSGHFYGSLFAHIVGYGFDNEHHRIFAQRLQNQSGSGPFAFKGYV